MNKQKKCPECKADLKEINVSVEGAVNKVKSWQCAKCGYIIFDKKSGRGVIRELKEKAGALNIKQRIIKISHNRLGMYFNENVVRNANLKPGDEVVVSMPDKNTILMEIKERTQ